MRLLIGLLGVVALIFIASLDDDEQPKRCTTCGLETVVSSYVGHGKPLRWICTQCGADVHVRT